MYRHFIMTTLASVISRLCSEVIIRSCFSTVKGTRAGPVICTQAGGACKCSRTVTKAGAGSEKENQDIFAVGEGSTVAIIVPSCL